MAKRFDIVASDNWFTGESKTLEIDVLQSDGATAQAMTGWTLEWKLLTGKGGSELISKSTGGSGIAIGNGDGTDDRATITIEASDTSDLVINHLTQYYHELWRTDTDLEALLSFGDVTIKKAGM